MPELRSPRKLSPYMLIQEFLRDDPWKLLAACIMLNQTSAKQVHRIINEFFDRWPDPKSFIEAKEDEVKELIKSLGFKNVRYKRLFGMSCDLMSWDTGYNIKDVYGVGKYAADSYRIFCEGYLVLDVTDKELKNYVRWAQEEGREEVRDSGTERCDTGSGGVQQGLPSGALPSHVQSGAGA